MPVLAISGVIGWDVEPQDVRAFLDGVVGEDIEVQISSPGGYIYPGLEIYNLLKNHDGKITTRLMGLAASMASYIAMVGDHVIAEDNAVFMIHNASGFAMGDHTTMRKAADVMEGLSNMLAQKYMKKTGSTLKEVKALMDAETFLFGDEILKAGFVDEIAETEESKDKKASVALATISIADCIAKMKASEQDVKEDIEKAAAFLNIKCVNTIDSNMINQYIASSYGRDAILKLIGGELQDTKDMELKNQGGEPKVLIKIQLKKEVKSMDLKEILAIEDAEERKKALETFFNEILEGERKEMVKDALMAIKSGIKPDKDLVLMVEGLQGEIKALQTEVVASKELAGAETEKRRMLEIKASLQDTEVVGDLDKMTKTIFTLENVSPDLAKDMIEQFKETSEKLKAAGLFTEIGSGSEGKVEDPYDKLKALVDTAVKDDPSITPAKAWKNVIRDNLELYKEYLKKK